MSLGRRNTDGGKGDTHSFEFRNLLSLGQIIDALGPVSGLATESTLQQVLAAIQDGQDFEAKLVVDDGGNGDTYLEVRIWNPDDQTWETPLYYAPGSNSGVPAASLTSPLVYINSTSILSTISSILLTQRESVSGGFVYDEDDVVWEVRWVYNPNTSSWTVSYYDSFGTLGNPNGDIIWASERDYGLFVQIESAVTSLNSTISAIEEIDNDAIASLRNLKIGGKAVDASTYSPAYTSGDNSLLAFNKDTGRALFEGQVGGFTGFVFATFVLDTGVAYADGDVLATPVELTDILRSVGGTGIIHSVRIVDEERESPDMDLVFLRANTSIGTLNSPVSMTAANASDILGIVNVAASDFVNVGGADVATKTNLGIGAQGSASDDLYLAAISRGTPTYSNAGSLKIAVTLLQD